MILSAMRNLDSVGSANALSSSYSGYDTISGCETKTQSEACVWPSVDKIQCTYDVDEVASWLDGQNHAGLQHTCCTKLADSRRFHAIDPLYGYDQRNA